MFEHVEIVARKWNWPRLPLISCPLPQEFADRTAWYFRYSDTHRESLWDRHVGWHSIVLRNSRLLRQKASTDNSPPARTVCWFISWTEDEEEEIIFSNIVNKEQGVRRKIISFTLYTIVKKNVHSSRNTEHWRKREKKGGDFRFAFFFDSWKCFALMFCSGGRIVENVNLPCGTKSVCDGKLFSLNRRAKKSTK